MNSKSGLCYPSYERIAQVAECSKDSVRRAIKVLEQLGILSWVHRIKRLSLKVAEASGQIGMQTRLIRTSNSYTFFDPANQNLRMTGSSEAQNQSRTYKKDSFKKEPVQRFESEKLSLPSNELDAALSSLGRAVAESEANEKD